MFLHPCIREVAIHISVFSTECMETLPTRARGDYICLSSSSQIYVLVVHAYTFCIHMFITLACSLVKMLVDGIGHIIVGDSLLQQLSSREICTQSSATFRKNTV